MIDTHKREYVSRGSVLFPMQYYTCDTTDVLYSLPMHWHTDFEILRITSGEYNMFINDGERTLCLGDVAFITSGVLHGDGADAGDAQFESVVFDPEILRHRLYATDTFLSRLIDIDTHGRLKASIALVMKAGQDDYAEALSIADKLFSTMCNKPTGYELLSVGLVMQLLGIIEGKHLYQEYEVLKDKTEKIERLKNALDYIKENYASPLTLDKLSGSVCLSSRYFCRLFREIMKCSPIDYLNKYRINRACETLRNSASSVEGAAHSNGFADVSYFIRLFRRYKGLTPLKYKKSMENIASIPTEH